uniref:ATP synthase subunit alpha n=1 Tax=Pleurostomum flabellatum TaxID=405751 RepID=A0A7T0Q5L1_9EUKA|nr:ATP synthase subunit alpha [Pleurostomum flabellatum]QPL15594.1 ATP synthase subunit alpha [Pleurostomum flabellatum]
MKKRSRKESHRFNYLNTLEKYSIGKVLSIQDSVIIATGLDNAFVGEVVKFKSQESDLLGQVLNLEKDQVRIVMINGKQTALRAEDFVYRTFKDVKTKSGYGILGRVVSPLGDCYNEEDFDELQFLFDEISSTEEVSVEVPSPGIVDREPVKTPFMTGINVIDTMIPVGCGQRELIIGDQNTGKTSLAITSILNQNLVNNVIHKKWRELEEEVRVDRHSNLITCIYVTIGTRRSEGARLKKALEKRGALNYTAIVYTHADQSAALQFLAPYAGCAIAEWFRDRGYRSIVIYDDLSSHAVAYRQMSLLLKRPPGREAYPGDVFYVHSRLLERASQLHRNKGGGSLTALPIIETKGGDISAYIPTNVISITDGQIFLSSQFANQGVRPAVNAGLSVSRVGSSAQYSSMNEIGKKIKSSYSLYKNYQGVEKLGGDIDPIVLSYITRGKRINVLFQQGLYETMRLYKQIVSLFALHEGFVDNVDLGCSTSFFLFLFNSELAGKYLEEKYFPYVAFPNEIECFLVSYSVKLFSKQFRNWINSYQKFFLSDLQPRILADKGNLLTNLLS